MVETMSAEEVAELLKVTQPTIYRWAKEGILPSSRLGRTLRFSRKDVERLMQEDSLPVSEEDDLIVVITDKVIEEMKRRGISLTLI